jgi:ssDNA-binding Zn-finger/Zn-ribbon topoisomerase 1
VPDCPTCGSPMVLRTARRGRNTGNEFWGCSAYPNCRATRLYEIGAVRTVQRDFGRRRVPDRPPPHVGRVSHYQVQKLIVAFGVIGILAAFLALEFGFPLVGCPIKGNISGSGERIYHLPGQKYYAATRINWFRGERWFCSETAAQAAGWRRAPI